MAISMTGYGRGEFVNDKFHFTVESKSVNNRYLDVNIKMPRKISYLEEFVRQFLKKYVSRGKVEVYIKLEFANHGDIKVGYDEFLAKEYVDVLNKISVQFELNNQISAMDVIKFPDVIKLQENEFDEEDIKKSLEFAMDEAFSGLRNMREIEGEKLKSDILERCKLLETDIDIIEKNAEEIESEYREKLLAKIQEVLDSVSYNVDEQRILQEAAIIADKSNITEEIVRFKSHILQLKEVLDTDSVGRKMDFILQEMNREVNTIGSKSLTLEITNYVVELKSELEKIREQVQNIE